MKRILLLLCLFTGMAFAQFANQPTTCTSATSIGCTPFQPFQQPPYPALAGLRVQIAAGTVNVGSLVVTLPAQTVTATASGMTYIYLNTTTGLINVNGSGFPSTGAYPIATAAANATFVYTLTDSRPNVFISGTGGTGGNPGTPTGSLQVNCASNFCGVPNSVVNLTTGNTTFSGLTLANPGALTFAGSFNATDINGNFITGNGTELIVGAPTGFMYLENTGVVQLSSGISFCGSACPGSTSGIALGVAGYGITFIGNSTSGYQFLNCLDSTCNTLASTPGMGSSGIFQATTFKATGISASANPICPNGSGGIFTTTGCNTGGTPSGTLGYPLINSGNPSSTSYATSPLEIDTSQFSGFSGTYGTCTLGTNDNICIANAVNAISGTPGSGGGYAIINHVAVTGPQTWTANPFANIISNGTTNFTSPQKCGVLRLSGGSAITMNQPFAVPRCWDVEIVSQRGEVQNFTASNTWPGIYTTGTVTNLGGTHIGTGAQYQFTAVGSGTSWVGNVVPGEIFAVCQANGANGTSCGGNPLANPPTCASACGNAAYGMVLAVTDNTHLIIGSNNAVHSLANPSSANYVIYAPLILLGTMGQTGGDSGGGGQTHWRGGTFNCASQSGCIDFANYSEQENTTLDQVILNGSTNTFLDVEGYVENSGPYSNFVINGSSNCTGATIPIISRNNVSATRPFQHWTIANDAVAGCSAVGVDWEESGELWDGHYESTQNLTSFGVAVSVGDNAGGLPSVACPVICIEPNNTATSAKIHGITVTTKGLTGVSLGSTQNTNILLEDIQTSSWTNVIVDNARACTIQATGGDSTIALYAQENGNNWFGTAVATANACASGGTYAGNLSANVVNAGTGFTIGGTAPSGHTLCGNGTNYVDGTCGGGGGSSVWSALTNATGNLTLGNGGFSSTFNQTSAVPWLWANTTTATSGTTNASPFLKLAANYWTGAASAQDLWSEQSVLAAGTNASSTLTFTHSGSTGAANVSLPGGLVLGGSTPVCGTASPAWCGTESGLTLTAAASVDGCQMNSTSHAILCTFNNSAIEPFPLLSGSFTAGHAVKVNSQLGSGASYDFADAGYSATAIPLADLATQGANTVLGNFTSGTAAPTATSVATCSANNDGITYTSGTGFTCNTSVAELNVAETFMALQTFGAQASIASTAHGVLLSENTSPVVATAVGASGTFLNGAGGGADPSFTTLAAGGGTLPENDITGAGAAATITEGGSTFSITRAGVSTANLTAPWVFQNTNSTNNNTSITLGVTAPGTSTGQTVLNVNGASTGGDLADFGTGGTWTAGVLSGQTIVDSFGITGLTKFGAGPAITAGTGGGIGWTCGTAPTGVASNEAQYCDAANQPHAMTGTTDMGIISTQSQTAQITGADWSCGTSGTVSSCVTAQTISTLTFTFPLEAKNWTIDCNLVVGQATGVTANNWNVQTATNGATNATFYYSQATAASAVATGVTADQASTTTTFNIGGTWTQGATGTKMPVHIWGTLEGVSASGTVFNLQLVAPTVGDLVTIYRGSSCRYY